jgi:hypothetical protein
MDARSSKTTAASDEAAVIRLLPGSDRKQTPQPYLYRLIYRNPECRTAGCVMLWEVTGGRASYQIAWERTAGGRSRFHCTCADAVFRGEDARHFCKHILGLLGRDSRARSA